MALVTVIVPAFQAALTLKRAIRSVVTQSFADWEMIVVDDASTDGTAAIVEEEAVADPRIRIVRQPKNRGAAAAMNLAWRSSSSPFLAILDSDDAAHPDRLRLQMDHLDRHPEISVLGAAAHFVDSHDRLMRTVYSATEHTELFRQRWYRCPFVHPTVTMRRTFLEATGGYAEELRLGEDYDLWMRGFTHPEFRYANLSVPLVHYRARTVQRWAMIRASAQVRRRAGRREGHAWRGWLAAGRILAEGALEQTRIFAARDRLVGALRPAAARNGTPPS